MAAHDFDPDVLLADRGYDSDAIRDDVRIRGGTPEIPTKKNRRVQHSVNRDIYALRNRIERFINRLKNSRRVATRYDHTATSFVGFILLTAIRQWIKFVHAA
jgi:transposase